MKVYSLFFALLFLLVCFTGCIERPVYYVSPYNGNSTSYHTMPLKKDSVKTATYASGSLYLGQANTALTDKVFNFEGSIYQAKQFGIFEAYYGVDASIGNYNVALYDSDAYATIDYQTLNANAGNKLYEGLGVEGGINLVHVTRHGEWRVIGTELTGHTDFGSYANFRKTLPATAANLIIRQQTYSTLGFNTESIRKTKHGSYSLKIAYGFVLSRPYNHAYALDFNSQQIQRLSYDYFTYTFQYTYQRWTAYLQAEGGTYASGYKLGAVYHW